MIKLLIVDDHPMILDGSKKLFSEVSDISVDTLNDIETFANVIEEKVYDIFLIDVNLGACSGLTFVELVKEKYPSSIVILYTGDNIKDYYSLIIEKKINNVISKTARKDRILKTIYATMNNDMLLPEDFIDYVNDSCSGNSIKKILRFNNREKRILELVMEGYTNQAIALELGVKQRTIENNLSQIYALLNVGTRAEAVIKAKGLDLI
ncbi:response regulator [Lysinibacillus xylanilyticus]|uniref:response regulator n=1 Tax=Lysinibacillus xylanilyticus TaxID=582475 RepID=UPI003D02B040